MNGRTDPERIVDMVQYSREAIATLGNTGFEEFSTNRQLQLGIFYLVAVVGEAASKCDPETLRQYPGILWHQVRGTRNHLVHDYYKVNLLTVYEIVVEHLPVLISVLQTTTPNPQGGQSL
ncbi:MAG: DUF86 domain-containing protein [Chloroflexota bacterium]|nr:DUF86 domain-containing protein [Chloroflexota bacterium]MDE2961896.1 DUF86 domain-containing protein [Chloroflexota bacterium]